MASIVQNKSGSRRIQYVDNGKRQSIPLGKKATQKQARAFVVKLEHLLTARFTGMDDETARWVAALPDDMHSKLANLGLVKPKATTQNILLADFIEWYITTKAVAVKPNTVLVWRQAQQSLVDYFGPDKPLKAIHEGNAELWRLSMLKLDFCKVKKLMSKWVF